MEEGGRGALSEERGAGSGERGRDETEILSPTNEQYEGREKKKYPRLSEQYAFGTWVARLIAAPLSLRARRVHQEGRNDLQLAGVNC